MIEQMPSKERVALLERLVNAVMASEFGGISCLDIDGKGNWFDVRNQVMSLRADEPATADEPNAIPDHEFERLVGDFGIAVSLWTSGGGSREDAKQKSEAVLNWYYARAVPPTRLARPRDEYHKDMGAVLWWKFPIQEPPFCGTPSDDDWIQHEYEGYYTHWSPFETPSSGCSQLDNLDPRKQPESQIQSNRDVSLNSASLAGLQIDDFPEALRPLAKVKPISGGGEHTVYGWVLRTKGTDVVHGHSAIKWLRDRDFTYCGGKWIKSAGSAQGEVKP